LVPLTSGTYKKLNAAVGNQHGEHWAEATTARAKPTTHMFNLTQVIPPGSSGKPRVSGSDAGFFPLWSPKRRKQVRFLRFDGPPYTMRHFLIQETPILLRRGLLEERVLCKVGTVDRVALVI